MTSITIYGASDDLVEVEGCKGADEFPLPSGDEWRGQLIAPNGEQMAVQVTYGPNGCWWIGVGQVDEGVPFPLWPLTIGQHESGYSVVLRIDAPDDTRFLAVGA